MTHSTPSKQSHEHTSLKRESVLIRQTETVQEDESNLKKTPKKKNRWLIQQEQLKLENYEEREQFFLAQKRIETICKKLEPHFTKEAFKLEYSKKNSQYIKENIEKILPLVESLPELQEFKNLLPTSTTTQQNRKNQSSSEKPG